MIPAEQATDPPNPFDAVIYVWIAGDRISRNCVINGAKFAREMLRILQDFYFVSNSAGTRGRGFTA
jgi:hypothetical protein